MLRHLFPSSPGASRRASRLIRAALLAGLALPAAQALTAGTPFIGAAQAATGAPTLDQMKQTLQDYGRFMTHERYGEVWIPSVTPQGWRPYAPCHWAYTQRLGWYYDDPTPWGRIVHHYGRWAHDASLGWIWVPGEEFSPGWVVWRTGEQWTGWAPMPPQQDVQTISAETFQNDKHWIFVETGKLGSRCEGESAGQAVPQQVPVLIERTRVVTQIRFVEGIAVVVVPAPVVISTIHVDIGIFAPWSPVFIGNIFWAWNWIWNNVTVVINVNNVCPPVLWKAPALKSDPPPPPSRRAEPNPRPEPKEPPVRTVDQRLPQGSDDVRPIDAYPVRPAPPRVRPLIIPSEPIRPRPQGETKPPRPPIDRPIVTRPLPLPQRPIVTRPLPLPERPVIHRPLPQRPVIAGPNRPVFTQPDRRVTMPGALVRGRAESTRVAQPTQRRGPFIQ